MTMTTKTATTLDARLRRVERVLAMLAADRYGGPAQGLGPMDPSWRAAREQVKADISQIVREANEVPIETRGAA